MVALTERVSGRIPEKRGNGLKYVTDVLSRFPKGSFSLQSGDAVFRAAVPLDTSRISEYITISTETIRGTYGEMDISL